MRCEWLPETARYPQPLNRGELTCKGCTMNLKDAIVQDNLETPKRFLGIRMAERAGMVAAALRREMSGQVKDAEAWEFTKKMSGMASTNEQKPTSGPQGEEMQVTVGDQQTTVYNMAQEQKSGTLGKFAKAAMLGAALLGSGGVGAAATMWACGLFNKPKAEPAPQVVVEAPAFDPDGYGLKIVPDSEIHE